MSIKKIFSFAKKAINLKEKKVVPTTLKEDVVEKEIIILKPEQVIKKEGTKKETVSGLTRETH